MLSNKVVLVQLVVAVCLVSECLCVIKQPYIDRLHSVQSEILSTEILHLSLSLAKPCYLCHSK